MRARKAPPPGLTAVRRQGNDTSQSTTDSFLVQFFAQLPEVDRFGVADFFKALAAIPQEVADIQARYYRRFLELWARILSEAAEPGEDGARNDPRFRASDWTTLAFFRLLKEAYLLNASWAHELVEAAPMDPARKRRLAFVVRQTVDAWAPTNFPATNPEVIRRAAQTRGASLAAGLENLRADRARGRIQMSDERAFSVGRDLAVTPGAVVYENPIAQLIQYEPRTPQVHASPLLIVPPFINKFYVLDLRPENSFVRFVLDQGLQVFMVSWRNVPPELGAATWDDYVRQGVLAPLDAVLEITAERALGACGFCVGGTLLTTALAVMPRPARVASLTLLAAMLDFSDVGEIGAYVDAEYVRACEAQFARGGRMPGSTLAAAFASLRANELVWRFVIDNYLKGLTPKPFDLLHWNGDSANLPGPLYAWYLRHMYLENRLREANALEVCGRRVDLSRVRAPAYVLATREDHIVPWRSAYASARLLAGTIDFVLGDSGHIAGVVNPPAAGRRGYCVGGGIAQPPEQWVAAAQRRPGSWWTHWAEWLTARSGPYRAAPATLGHARYPVIEPAPGRYVREPAR